MQTTLAAPLLLVTQSAFQVALSAGAPWGRAAFGGRHDGVLPPPMRVASGASALVLAGAAAALASSRTAPRARRLVTMACVGIGAYGTVANAVSRSPVERPWSIWALALGVASWRELRRTPR